MGSGFALSAFVLGNLVLKGTKGSAHLVGHSIDTPSNLGGHHLDEDTNLGDELQLGGELGHALDRLVARI